MFEYEYENLLGFIGWLWCVVVLIYGFNGWIDFWRVLCCNILVDLDDEGIEVEFGDDEEDVYVFEELEEEEDEFDEDEVMVDDDIND